MADESFETARHKDIVRVEYRDPLALGLFHKFIETLVSASVAARRGSQIPYPAGVCRSHPGSDGSRSIPGAIIERQNFLNKRRTERRPDRLLNEFRMIVDRDNYREHV